MPKGDPRAGDPHGNPLQTFLLFPTRSFISKLMPTLLSASSLHVMHFLVCAILTFSSRRCGSPSVKGWGSALRSSFLNQSVPCTKCIFSCCVKIRIALLCAAPSPGQPAGSSGDSGFLDSINILLMKYCFVKESWKLKRVFKLLPVSQYHVMSTLPRKDNSEMSHKACVMPFAVWQNSSAFMLFNPSSEIFCSEKVWDQSCQYLLTQSWCKSLCCYWLHLSCNDLPQARIKPKLGIWETQYQTFKEDGAEWHRCWKWECGWK